MKRSISKSDMKIRISALTKLIRKMERMLKGAPEGSLRVSSSKTRVQYYRVDEKHPRHGTYLKKNDPMIRRLAQKDYCRQVLKAAEEELAALVQCQASLPEIRAEDCYELLSEERKRLVKPLILTDEEFVKGWRTEPYGGKGFWDADHSYVTDNGERVRSKSELIIANMLKHMEVPYRYEYPLALPDGRIIYPDFLVLNVREKREMVWEHFGMMDDGAYSEKAIRKIRSLQEAGYFPGDKMIMTFETSKQPLDTAELRTVIRTYLQ